MDIIAKLIRVADAPKEGRLSLVSLLSHVIECVQLRKNNILVHITAEEPVHKLHVGRHLPRPFPRRSGIQGQELILEFTSCELGEKVRISTF